MDCHKSTGVFTASYKCAARGECAHSQLLLQLLPSMGFPGAGQLLVVQFGGVSANCGTCVAATAVCYSCSRGPPDSLISCALLQAHEEHAVGQ